MKRILWIGDAGCPSGFGLATHKILEGLDHRLDGEFEMTVLGINYRGDPHEYPYHIYAAVPGGDAFGIGRLIWMCDQIRPDMIILQNDGWNIQFYVKKLKEKFRGEYNYPEYADIPIVAAVAVDGKNFRGEWLNGISHAIFWTEFALKEARQGGYSGPASVIPLGVDLDTFYPTDKQEARVRRFGAATIEKLGDIFIVGNVNRNQPRKRWDLTIRYFAEWVKRYNITDAYLYMHTAPTGDQGIDARELTKYYGVFNRLILVEPPMHYGIAEDQLRDTYNGFDVQISTTQGEGFGLTTFEGMACGVPQIVPDWASLGELCQGAASLVPCSSTAIGQPYVNVIGGIADEETFIRELDKLYTEPKQHRDLRSDIGLKRVHEDRYRWSNIGKEYSNTVKRIFAGEKANAWEDLGRPAEALEAVL